jgi:hypothetical protein
MGIFATEMRDETERMDGQGIRKIAPDTAQLIKQRIRWIPNNSGPSKRRQRNHNLGEERRVPENADPAVLPAGAQEQPPVLNSSSEFRPSPPLPLFQRKTTKDTNYKLLLTKETGIFASW